MLTKKHFKEIAEIVLNNTDKFKSIALKYDFINDLSDYFIEVNPNFNRDKFIDACHNSQSKWKQALETEIEKKGRPDGAALFCSRQLVQETVSVLSIPPWPGMVQ